MIFCPKHPKNKLYTLSYRTSNNSKKSRKKGVKLNPFIRIGWVYCEKCKKPIKLKVVIN